MDFPIIFRRLLLLLVLALLSMEAQAKLVLEHGYTVNTVLYGDKSNIKVTRHSILHQSPPSDLFVLLDSVASTFYTVSMPPTSSSGNTDINRLAGNGQHSYADGDLSSATFNKPRSFAIDYNGNVYVADQANHVIRKITKSGVTTIAGGYSQKTGNADGPAQNASFSNDFLLAFIPGRCALMITDHSNRLVRQINLKADDCTLHSQSSVLGATSVWILALGLSCIFGIIVGFVARPYILQYEGNNRRQPGWTWNHFLMNLERQTVMLCSVTINAVVKSPVYSFLHQVIKLSLSILSLMFRPPKVKPRTAFEKPVSLLDLDGTHNSSSNSNMVFSPDVDNQLQDLLDFDNDRLMLPMFPDQDRVIGNAHISSGEHNNIDNMILANLMKFGEQSPVNSDEARECSSGLVKRK